MKDLQRIQGLTYTDKLDRLAGYFLNGQRCTATGITFHLGENHTGNLKIAVKLFRYGNSILTGHGVGNKENFRKLNDS